MNRLKSLRLLPSSAGLKMAIELGVIYVSLQLALPAALAVYPQTASFPATSLEPQFHNFTRADGTKITTFYANKGL